MDERVFIIDFFRFALDFFLWIFKTMLMHIKNWKRKLKAKVKT